MEQKMKIQTAVTSLLLGVSLMALNIGEIPKSVTIDNDNGGLVTDGSKWDSSSIKDKVLVLFYVDPDEKDTNNEFTEAIQAKEYDRSRFGSIGVINLAATWLPNVALNSALDKKQKKYPHTVYVKDKNKVLVKEWAIADDASNVLIFSKDGKLRFEKSGKMTEEEIQNAIKIIEENM
jgi:predicted transcriptional regulator